MTAERQQLGTAIGLSATANALLLLALVWAMAVTDGLTAGKRPRPGLVALPAPPETVNLVLSSTPDKTVPETLYIASPENAPPALPHTEKTKFVSSQNMRAASNRDASPDGIPGLATQEGVDQPFLDLTDADFRQTSHSAGNPSEITTPPPENATLPVADSPPAPDARLSNADAASSLTPPTPSIVSPEEKAVAAFQNPDSPNLIPLPSPTAGTQNNAPRLTRPPDRSLSAAHQQRTKKSRSNGTISNKADEASLDAAATVEGRFAKALIKAIEGPWRTRTKSLNQLANPGNVEVAFEIDPKGRISNVRLVNPGEANPVMQDCAISAVIDAQLPVPPAELFTDPNADLTGGRLRLTFSFLML